MNTHRPIPKWFGGIFLICVAACIVASQRVASAADEGRNDETQLNLKETLQYIVDTINATPLLYGEFSSDPDKKESKDATYDSK